MNSLNLKKYIEEFLEHIETKGRRSKKTIQNYSFYLNRFVDWLNKKNPEAITAEKVNQYRLWLNRLTDVHGDSLKTNTQNYHLIALRSFLKYLAKRNIKTMTAEKIQLMKMPEREVDFLESGDLDRLLEAPLLNENTKTRKHENTIISSTDLIKYRDKAILELLFSTGLRVSELAKLKKNNLNFKKDEFIITGESGKTRTVFLSEQTKYWLKKYLDARKDSNPHLFISHDKRTGNTQRVKPLTPRSIQRMVQKYAGLAGISKTVTPHTLRHSYATNLLQKGADIHNVQTMLGHSSVASTKIYTHITGRELKNIYNKFRGKKRGD